MNPRFNIGAALAALALIGTAGGAYAQSAGEKRLHALIESGQLKVNPKLQTALGNDRILSIVHVELAPGVTEQRHTHPGLEVIYGLSGTGFVALDGKNIAIEPGAVVKVENGHIKALTNISDEEPLVVLAVLVVDANQPVLKVVE